MKCLFSVTLIDRMYVVKQVYSFQNALQENPDYIISEATFQKTLTGLVVNGIRHELKSICSVLGKFDYDIYVKLSDIPFNIREKIPQNEIKNITFGIFKRKKCPAVSTSLRILIPNNYPERHQYSHYSLITPLKNSKDE